MSADQKSNSVSYVYSYIESVLHVYTEYCNYQRYCTSVYKLNIIMSLHIEMAKNPENVSQLMFIQLA